MGLLWVRQEWDEELHVGASESNAKLSFEVVTDDREYAQPDATADLWAFLVANGFDTYGNLPVSAIDVKRLKASKCFLGEVSYGPRSLPQDGAFDFTVESRPETRKQLTSRANSGSYAPPGRTPASDNGFVGVTDEGTAVGVDVSYTVSHYNAQVYWDTNRLVVGQPDANHRSLQAYRDLLKRLENKVNSTFFQFFAVGALEKFQPGECKLLSVKRSFQGPTLIRFDLELESTPLYVETILTPMNGSVPVLVSGFDRLEISQQKEVDPATGTLRPIAASVLIPRIYDRDDLNLLLIPTPP